MAQSVRIQVVDRSLRVVRRCIISSVYATCEFLEPGINMSCVVCHKLPRSEERKEQEDLGSDCTAPPDLTGVISVLGAASWQRRPHLTSSFPTPSFVSRSQCPGRVLPEQSRRIPECEGNKSYIQKVSNISSSFKFASIHNNFCAPLLVRCATKPDPPMELMRAQVQKEECGLRRFVVSLWK